MIPILLISKSKKNTDSYVSTAIKNGGYKKHSIYTIEKDKSILSIDKLREIRSILKRSGSRKLIIIKDFETVKEESQNILLKTLEEDIYKAQFITICSDESVVLPTITSRCRIVRLSNKSEKSTSTIDVDVTGSLAGNFVLTDKIKKKDAVDLIDVFLDKYREELRARLIDKKKQDLSDKIFIIRELFEVRKLIEKNNLNPQMGVDHILMMIYKIKKTNTSQS